MDRSVAIVTDSTAYLDAGAVAAHDLTVVPLQVVIGGKSLSEGDEVGPGEVADALRHWTPVSTSRPAPGAFLAAYEAAAAAGAAEVVSIHLSAEISGTVDAARMAAREASLPVTVVDSRSLAMGLGFAVLSAAAAVEEGCGAAEAAARASRRASRTSGLFYVDTLEHLRRGGRIGSAAAFLGTALAVKPLLHMVKGRIEPLEKVRTAARALARLEELAVERAGGAEVDLAVHHLADPDTAAALAERLSRRVPGAAEVLVTEVGAVVGAHVGPGMIAVVVSPR